LGGEKVLNKDNIYNDDLDSSNISSNTNYNSKDSDDSDLENLNNLSNLNSSNSYDIDGKTSINNQNEYPTDNPTDFNFESGVKYSSTRQSPVKTNSKNKSKINSKSEIKATLKEAFKNSEFYIFFKVWLNINRWGLFVYIIIVSFCVVFFVSNVRVVTKLLDDIVKLNKFRNEINSKNKILEVKLVEMQSPERINKIAIEQLGFEKATEAPFYIDKSKY